LSLRFEHSRGPRPYAAGGTGVACSPAGRASHEVPFPPRSLDPLLVKGTEVPQELSPPVSRGLVASKDPRDSGGSFGAMTMESLRCGFENESHPALLSTVSLISSAPFRPVPATGRGVERGPSAWTALFQCTGRGSSGGQLRTRTRPGLEHRVARVHRRRDRRWPLRPGPCRRKHPSRRRHARGPGIPDPVDS
jgi:hypothetical protein